MLRGDTGAPPARLVGATAPRWPSGLPAGPLRSRLAEVTKERALLPLLAVTSRARRAQRTGPARQGHRRGRAARRRRRPTGARRPGWLLELQEVAGHDDERERITTRLLSLGLAAEDADVVTVAARATGRSLEGRSSSPTVPLEAARAGAGGLPARAGEPGRHDRGEPARARSTTSTRSSSTTSGWRCGAPARCWPRARGCCPTTSATRYREAFGELGQQTGPARDLDVYVAGWDAYVAPLGLAGDPGLDKVTARDRAPPGGRPRRAVDGAPERRRAGALIDGWRAWLADPNVEVGPSQHLGPGRGRADREGAGEGAHRRPSHHARRRRASGCTTCARTPRSSATCSSASDRCSPPTSARRS